MNTKGIIVIAGIAAVISLVFLLPVKPTEILPQIVDEVGVNDKAGMDIALKSQDLPQVSDTVDVNQTNSNFYIDEDGKKHYSLQAIDKPTVKP